MTVYHGSEFVVEKPQHGIGKRTNDYGLGFYCTEDKTLAGEWSVSPLHDGFVNQYEIDIDTLKVLNLADGRHTVLHWLAILLENRTFDIEGDVIRNVRFTGGCNGNLKAIGKLLEGLGNDNTEVLGEGRENEDIAPVPDFL